MILRGQGRLRFLLLVASLEAHASHCCAAWRPRCCGRAQQHVSLRPNPPNLLGRCGLPLFANAGGLTAQAAQVVQLGATHVTAGDDLDLVEGGGVYREGTLHADTKGDLADGEGLTHASTLTGNDYALEDLNTSTFAFNNLHVHLDGVTGAEVGDVVTNGRCIDRVELVHDYSSSCHRSETRSGDRKSVV